MTERIDRLRERVTSDIARDEWRQNLRTAWDRLLATRERMTRRHAEMKRIAQRWPAAAQALDPAPSAARASKASGTLYR